MSRCSFTFSANTGGALSLGPFRIWYDALHRRKVPSFSTLSPALLEAVEADPAFSAPDMIYFSHCHPDHFSRSLLISALERWPTAHAVLPEQMLPNQVLLTGRTVDFSSGDLHLRFRRLLHEGAQYAQLPHYGCLLQYRDYRVLLTGDCAVACDDLAELIDGAPIDVALLNFPWLTLPRGRAAISDWIRPRHLLIGHLPFQEDDRWGYRPAAQRAMDKLPAVADIRLLLEPLQREEFS